MFKSVLYVGSFEDELVYLEHIRSAFRMEEEVGVGMLYMYRVHDFNLYVYFNIVKLKILSICLFV